MTPPRFCFDGLPTVDGRFRPDVAVELRPDGVAYWTGSQAKPVLIPTRQRPEPGAKVDALGPLGPILTGPHVERVTAGGGALNTALTLAGLLEGFDGVADICLLNSGEASPAVMAACMRAGIRCESFHRQATPCNLEVPLRSDRIVIRGSIETAPADLDDRDLATVRNGLNAATAHASVSAKDAALASAAAAVCNGARRYFQPTGSLPAGLTFGLLAQAEEAVCNLAEWNLVARWAGMAPLAMSEESAEAPEVAALLLRGLHARCAAAVHAAVCTIGRNGAVVMDWDRDRGYHVRPECDGCAPSVPTPARTGDLFLGAWIFYRETWSSQGHLRDPLAATCVRATRHVVRSLGLRDDDCDVRVRQL